MTMFWLIVGTHQTIQEIVGAASNNKENDEQAIVASDDADKVV